MTVITITKKLADLASAAKLACNDRIGSDISNTLAEACEVITKLDRALSIANNRRRR